jgi:XTP/dITP diphosphohydrolase
MKHKVLLVTSNHHKLSEFKEMMDSSMLELISLKDIGFNEEIIEDQMTYHEQAIKKVEALIQFASDLIIIADDSGIEIEAFDYKPGVHSARFKPEMTQHERNEWICEQVQASKKTHAAFVCAIACYIKGQPIFVTENRCFGDIASIPSHDFGFGYDPIFIPSGYDDTFQTLPKSLKNQISHRALAIQALMHYLKGVL